MIKKINLFALILMLVVLTACGKGGSGGEGKKESNEFRVGMEWDMPLLTGFKVMTATVP